MDKKELFVVDSFIEVEEQIENLNEKIDSIAIEHDSAIDEVKKSIGELSSEISEGCDELFERATKESSAIIAEVEEAIESQKGLFESMLTSSIQQLAKEIRAEIPNIPELPKVDEIGISTRAYQQTYEAIRPLIPIAETPDTIRDKFDISLLTKKIDAKFISNLEDYIDGSKIKNLPLLGQRIIEHGGVGGFIETPIKAGANIVVTKDASGAWVITSTASGGGSSGFQDFTVNRSGNYISSVVVGAVTFTITRTGSYISSVTNGTETLTFTRNGSNQITSGTVS